MTGMTGMKASSLGGLRHIGRQRRQRRLCVTARFPEGSGRRPSAPLTMRVCGMSGYCYLVGLVGST